MCGKIFNHRPSVSNYMFWFVGKMGLVQASEKNKHGCHTLKIIFRGFFILFSLADNL